MHRLVRFWLSRLFTLAIVGALAVLCCRAIDAPPHPEAKGLRLDRDGRLHWVPMTEEEAAQPWKGQTEAQRRGVRPPVPAPAAP